MRYDLTCAQAGHRVSKSPGFIAREIHAGHLPAIRVGRTYRIAQCDLDAYIERARVRPKDKNAPLRQAVANHLHEAAERRCQASGL